MQGPAPFPAPPPIPSRPVPAAPSRRHRIPLWLGILLGVLIGVVALVGIGIYWTWNQFTSQAITAMNEQPAVQRCIGKIQHSSLDLGVTGDDSREDGFAFHVSGPHGSGMVVAVFTTVDAEHERIDEGELRLDNGKTLPLVPGDDDEDGDEEGVEDLSCL